MCMGAGLQYRAGSGVQADWRGFVRYPGGWEEDIGEGGRAENCAHLEELAENSVRPSALLLSSLELSDIKVCEP